MSNISDILEALSATGRAARNVGDLAGGVRDLRGMAARGGFVRDQAKNGGDLRRARAELEAQLRPINQMNSASASQLDLDQRREKVLSNMLKMQKSYEQASKSAGDKETAEAFKDKARAVDQLRGQYESLEKQERRYMELAKRVNELKRKGSLSSGEAAELARANAEMDQLAPQFQNISDNMNDINEGAEELGKNMGGAVSDGTEQSAKHMKDFGDNTDGAVRKTGKLAELWQSLKDNMGKITAGALLGSAFAEFSELTNKTIEGYYDYGESLSRVDHGILRLSKDTWNLARVQGKLAYAAIEANMPMEAMQGVVEELSKKTRVAYRPGGQRRYDVLLSAGKNIGAFSRVTGASIEQSTELYTRFINHFGKTHKQAIDGLASIARSGQLVNEQLHDMGVNGGIFINDLTGIINDAAQAFDGFTLNVDHLSSRVAWAVKTGQELGMTYDQSMDSAKQLASLFSKPGGFLGFQAGEQLREDIMSITRGIDDAEQRAQILSDKYKVSLSTGRTLDIASKDVNAQMQVIDILKGTDAGMEKQFDLLSQYARNNKMSLEIAKQFMGGENLSAEQIGDLMQVVQRGGNFKDFKGKINRSQKDAQIDQLIRNSVLGPKMIKDWLITSTTNMKTYAGQTLLAIQAAKAGATAFAKVAKWGFLFAAIVSIPKMMRLAAAWAMDRFGDKIIWAKQLMTKLGKFTQHTFAKAGPYIDSGLQLAKNMFRYVRSGQLFDKLGIFIKVAKGYLAEIPKLLHNIWALFRTGAAKVSLTRGGKAAGRLAARAYGRAARGFKDAGASLGGSGLDSWSGVMDDVGGFAGEAMDPFSGPYGSGEAGKAEHYEARKRAVMNKRRMRQEEAEWRKAGKNVRWQKLRRTMGRIGKVTEPVAGHIGNAGFYGGLGGKIMAGTAILAGGMGLMSAFDVGMSDNLSEPDDEKNKAGYRKYGDKIEANQKDLDTTNEALEYTRETHDQALIAALEAERAAKIAEKDLLDKKSKHLNDTEAAYERKRKVIETLQSYQKRLKKMGKDKEADAMEKRLDELKKDAGKDKGELASYGVSTKTENQKWQKVNDWAVKAEMMVSSFFSIVTNWKFLGGMGAKIVSLGSSLVKYVAPALTKMTGWILKLVGFAKAGSAFSWIGGMIEKVADIGGKVATKISPLLKFVKGLGVFEKLGAVVSKLATLGQWIGRFLGILDGVMIAAQTEGSWGRRLFAGVTGGVASLGTRAASDFGGAALEATGAGAVAGGALQIAGNTAAPWIGSQVADIATRNLWDRFMTTDSQIPTVMPSSVVDVGTGGSVSASGTGTKVDASGATTLTLKINNMKEITESANSRIVANNSGLSGGR